MADRSLTVRLRAEVDQYRRNLAQAREATEDLGDAGTKAGAQVEAGLDSAEDAGEELKLTLASIGRDKALERLAIEAHRAGEAMDDAAADARHLDRAIDEVSAEITRLNRELLRTGDMSLFGEIDRERAGLQVLQRMRRELGALREDAEVVRTSFREALAGLPAEVKGLLLVALVGALVFAAPLIGGALAAAVVGAVGAGGIVGGIVAASRDARVAAAAEELVERLERPWSQLGAAFVEPAVAALNTLANEGVRLLMSLRPELLGLRPLVGELAEGLAGFFQEAEPGFAAALRAAQPILRSIAQELPDLGRAFGVLLSTISEDTDGAIMALRAVFDLLEYSLEGAAIGIRTLSTMFQGLVKIQMAFGEMGDRAFGWVPGLGHAFRWARDRAIELNGAVVDAGDAGVESADAIETSQLELRDAVERANEAMREQHNILRAQVDPAFALLDAQQRVKDAQDALNEAIKKHGKNSREADEATAELARAVLDLDGAATEAAIEGFDGQLEPALRATLEAAGLTDDEIKAIEASLREARDALDEYEGEYRAKVTTEFVQIGTPSALPAFGRSVPYQHGGPVIGPSGVDRIPARLTAGEHVWTVQEVQAAGGHAAVEAMRAAVLASQSRHSVPAVSVTPSPAPSAAPTSTVTYAIYPQRAEFTIQDLDALVRQRDALARAGRPR